METFIGKDGKYTVVFVVLEGRVYVHYFHNSNEIEYWDALSEFEQKKFDTLRKEFFNQNKHLTEWSY